MSVLGIDLGGSATKLAELEDGRIAGFAEAPSPVRMESLFDRDGQYSGNGTIRLERVEKIPAFSSRTKMLSSVGLLSG